MHYITDSYSKFRLFLTDGEGVPTGDVVDLEQYMLEKYGDVTLDELHKELVGRRRKRQRLLFRALGITRVGQWTDDSRSKVDEIRERIYAENPELFPYGGTPRNLRRFGLTDAATVREILSNEKFLYDIRFGAGGEGGYSWALPENLWAVYRDEKLKLLDPYDRWG